MRLALALCLFAFAGPLEANVFASNSSSAEVERSARVSIPEVMMDRLQQDLDLEPFQAAAILGNLAYETGNFTMLKQIGGSAFGYSQWMGARRSEFFAFAEAHGGPHSFDANYGFLLHELTTEYEGMLSRIRSSEDMEKASRIFMREFLRPNPAKANLSSRVSYARGFLQENFNGSGCLGPEHLNGNRISTCHASL